MTFSAKITEAVSDSQGCKDDDGVAVALLTADVHVEIIYKSEHAIYSGPELFWHEPQLKHSTAKEKQSST